MTCDEFDEALDAEGEVDADTRRRLHRHYVDCRNCRKRVSEQISFVLALSEHVNVLRSKRQPN